MVRHSPIPTLHDLHDLRAQQQSQLAGTALEYFQKLYQLEREAAGLQPAARYHLRQDQARPAADALHAWLIAQRTRVPNGSAIAKAIDYALKRWGPLTHYLSDAQVPLDNNWLENRIRQSVNTSQLWR